MNHATLHSLHRALLCVITLAILSFDHVVAQIPSVDDCVGGHHFIIVLPDTVSNAFDRRFPPREEESFVMLIYSATTQDVRISRKDGLAKTKRIAAGEMIEFDMEEMSIPFVSLSNTPFTAALHVEADDPVILYVYLSTHYGCAAFTPIPVERWGKEYRAATWQGGFVRDVVPLNETNYDATRKVAAPGEIVVVAAYDDTRVTIDPAGSLANCVGCATVTLQAGEAYQVQSSVDTAREEDTQSDLAGTRITADKPIGVLSGNTRSSIEPPTVPMLAGNTIKDLMVEWLRPTTSHGSTFVMMPNRDDLRPRPNADPIREAEYARIIPSYDEMTTVHLFGQEGSSTPQEITESPVALGDGAIETMEDFVAAVAFTTSGPAAVYQSPKSVSRYNGTTGSGNFIGASYLSWGSYLVEATPREQWTSFAPFRAPSKPSPMQHYLNLVTDTANQFNVYFRQGTSPRQQFPFNRGRIPGTDLVWGSIAVNPAVTYRLEGEEGARFGGYLYGHRRGYELYRPGGTEEEKGSDAAAAHPSEYEEDNAQYYAYPLASGYCALREADGLHYDVTEMGCGIRLVTIRVVGDEARGIGSVALDGTFPSFNTRLEFVTPSDPSRLSSETMTEVVVRLSPIDPTRDAAATLRFTEKGSGAVDSYGYRYDADALTIALAGAVDFGTVGTGQSTATQELVVWNNAVVPGTIRAIRFLDGTRGFRIVRIVPDIDSAGGTLRLEPGGNVRITLDATPLQSEGVITDTLEIVSACGAALRVPLVVRIASPCIRLPDLDFGMMLFGERRSVALRICNEGSGTAIFDPGLNGEIVSGIGALFTIAEAEIERLRAARLEAGECITVDVVFTAPTEEMGVFRDTARFHTNSGGCRDTSIWVARVDTISGVDEPSSISGLAVSPNPAGDALTVGFTLHRASDARIVLYDASGRVAASLDAGRLSAGAHRIPLDLSGLPSGMYLMRVSGKGLGERDQRVMILR